MSHIREVDAIVHVIRCFEDDNIIHVDGTVNSLRDLETINLELIFSDIEMVERRIDRTKKAMKGDRTLASQLAVFEKFTGKIQQIPPMYSALKVGGRKLCDLARRGVEIERTARPITIHELHCAPTESPADYTLDVLCSSGTYIRTLCADLGAALGCGGVMAALERTQTGSFSIKEAHTVSELAELSENERLACLIPTERLFDSLPAVSLPEFFEKLCRGGCEIYQKKLRTDLPTGQRVRLCRANGSFFALGEVRDYPDGSAIKAIKLFELE